eukprot:TRINITY_DN12705_c0_g2_i1.p1 TRINITY_DN12705_c0_g2~~TRINITY_DN12705_c0_g2_i1.p1  ORF type:complete len:486 (-),score=116.16 TRINITY_DN12705_c0_g2_i1:41-1498(-)
MSVQKVKFDLNPHRSFLTEPMTQKSSPKAQGLAKLRQAQAVCTDMADTLDTKLNRLLSRQEQDYISCFKYFVMKKEDEVVRIAEKLKRVEAQAKKNESAKIRKLEAYSEAKQRESLFLNDLCKDSNKELIKWKSKAINLSNDSNFLEKRLKTVTKELKVTKAFLLKIGESLEEVARSFESTEMNELHLRVKKFSEIQDFEQCDELVWELLNYQPATESLSKTSEEQTKRTKKRINSMDMEKGKPPKVESNQETIKEFFNSDLEKTITQLKNTLKKQQAEITQLRDKLATDKILHSDLEKLFLACVDQARVEIYKRKVRASQRSPKKSCTEETLSRLSELRSSQINLNHFTAMDKENILRLFVENEQVVQTIYDAMFPSKISEYLNTRDVPSESSKELPSYTIEKECCLQRAKARERRNFVLPRLRQLVENSKAAKPVFKTHLNSSVNANTKRGLNDQSKQCISFTANIVLSVSYTHLTLPTICSV